MKSLNDRSDNLVSLRRLFADDTSIGYTGCDIDIIHRNITHDLTEMSNWSKTWLMSFNSNKTEIVFFSKRDCTDDLLFSLDNQHIPLHVQNHKHLGITLSAGGKWNEHIENVVKNISKHLSVLRKLKFRLNRNNLEKTLFKLYQTII